MVRSYDSGGRILHCATSAAFFAVHVCVYYLINKFYKNILSVYYPINKFYKNVPSVLSQFRFTLTADSSFI